MYDLNIASFLTFVNSIACYVLWLFTLSVTDWSYLLCNWTGCRTGNGKLCNSCPIALYIRPVSGRQRKESDNITRYAAYILSSRLV